MSSYIIPTGPNPFYRQTTTLEGVSFGLSFSYNSRCACWYLSVADAHGVDIVNGVKVVCGLPLLRRCADPRKPAGDFFVISASADRSPPGLGDLTPNSGRCQLVYVTSDWIALLKSGHGASLLALPSDTSSLSTYGAGS